MSSGIAQQNTTIQKPAEATSKGAKRERRPLALAFLGWLTPSVVVGMIGGAFAVGTQHPVREAYRLSWTCSGGDAFDAVWFSDAHKRRSGLTASGTSEFEVRANDQLCVTKRADVSNTCVVSVEHRPSQALLGYIGRGWEPVSEGLTPMWEDAPQSTWKTGVSCSAKF